MLTVRERSCKVIAKRSAVIVAGKWSSKIVVSKWRSSVMIVNKWRSETVSERR